MKTIGILGGMSWESTREYYRLLNEAVRERIGGLHSAQIIMASVDFDPLARAMNGGDWNFIERTLTEHAVRIAAAGAELLIIATNTMHKLASPIAEAAAPARLIHIGDCAAEEALRRGFSKVLLLGTRFTMEEDFYTGRLRAAGIEAVIPDDDARKRIDDIIFSELCIGDFRSESRAFLANAVRDAAAKGAEAVVLGCTELPLLLTQEESPLPILNTMALHAAEAVKRALS